MAVEVSTSSEGNVPDIAARSIYLVDSCLQDHWGHYFQYARSFYEAAARHGVDFRVWAHAHPIDSVREQLPLEPVFRPLPSSGWSLPKPLMFVLKLIEGNLVFYRDLASAPQKDLGRNAIVFASTTDHSQLLAWGLWLLRFRPETAPTLVLMLHISYFRPLKKRWLKSALWLRGELKILEILSRRYRIRLVTDSASLRDEYARITRLPIHVLPIPHTDSAATTSARRPAGPLRIAVLGGARREKGFVELSQAIRELSEQNEMEDLQFLIQCYYSPKWGPEVGRSIEMLRSLRLPQVTLIEEALDAEAYRRLLSTADIVIVPYHRDRYYAATSGPFTEALAAAKPVIVTAGTWMSEQLSVFGAGLTFEDSSPADLARAIRTARDLYDDLSAQALQRQPAWVGYHNAENFFREFMACCS